MSRAKAILGCLATLVTLTSTYPAVAQPPQDDDLRELIVLLAPQSLGAPSPEEVVDAVNAGVSIPGGLGEGEPDQARLAITRRAGGREIERIAKDPDSDEAKLQRYVVLRYALETDLDAVMGALAQNELVEFVEKNKRARLHAAASPVAKGDPPTDGLLGTPASPPEEGQWGLHLLRLPEAACLGDGGHAHVAIIDRGLQVMHEDLALNGVDDLGNPTLGPFRAHMSRDLAFNNCGVDELDPEDGITATTAGHGSHVTGTVAARTNDGGPTVAGGCWHCSVQSLVFEGAGGVGGSIDTVVRSLDSAKRSGVQIVNMSFGFGEPPCAAGDLRPLCTAIRAATARDIVLVASSGNDRTTIDQPANDPRVIAVGGLEWTGVGTDGRPTAAFWDEFPNCPPFTGQRECGSNFGPEQDLAAPARDVLSTTYVGYDHNDNVQCGDSFLPAAGPGYGGCRGTSMAAPHVTALVGQVRSVNPLLSRDAVKAIATSTASQAGNHSHQLGFGIPDAEAAVLLTLGEAGGQPLANRLAPLFSFFGESAFPDPVNNPDYRKAETHVYTTVPSTGSAWIFETDDPIDPIGPPVPGFPSFPQAPCVVSPCFDPEPGASIYVFTTDKPPFPGAPPLVPLYRLRYDPDIFADCDSDVVIVPHRDWAYTTTVAGVLHFKDNVIDADGVGYDLDGIEGYIYKSCEGTPGCTPPPGTVKVYRMFNAERDDYAIFPETELAAMVAAGYVAQPTLATVIGYAYLNVDTDGDTLIDGWEDLIGTHPALPDSDCDGMSDGHEVQVFDLSQNGYGDPLMGPCSDAIFFDGFESGDFSRWSAVQP